MWDPDQPLQQVQGSCTGKDIVNQLRKDLIQLEYPGQIYRGTNFWMEVIKILETKAYNLTDEEKALVVKNWLGREGLQLIKSSTNEEKE